MYELAFALEARERAGFVCVVRLRDGPVMIVG